MHFVVGMGHGVTPVNARIEDPDDMTPVKVVLPHLNSYGALIKYILTITLPQRQ